MTYNFDPERWYEMELAFLEREVREQKIDNRDFRRRVAELDRKLAEMWQRLDGSYRLPG